MTTPTKSAFALGSFSTAGCPPFAGVVSGDRVIAVEALRRLTEGIGEPLARTESVFGLLQQWPANFAALAAALERVERDAPNAFVPLAQLTVHAPFEPRTIYAAGANYRQHVIDIIVDRHGDPALSAEENRRRASATMDERAAKGAPFVFIKSVASLNGPHDDVRIPPDARQPDWELELALVIGRTARHVNRAEAFDVIAGYAIANDISDRAFTFRPDAKELGADWLGSKCSPTYTPFGPFVVPAAFVADPHALEIKLALNGKLMQDADTSDMIFPIPRLIEYLSSRVELRPGDIVLTGSPQGNGTHYNRYLQPGDVMDASITGLGAQRSRCVAEIEQWQSTASKLSSTA